MKRFLNLYKQNNNAGLPFNQLISKVLRKAEMLSAEVAEAIQLQNIEKRCLKSEELLRIMVEIHETFQPDDPNTIRTPMQKYCLQNINLITKINLKNDKDLAIALMESCGEIAKIWEMSEARPTEN